MSSNPGGEARYVQKAKYSRKEVVVRKVCYGLPVPAAWFASSMKPCRPLQSVVSLGAGHGAQEDCAQAERMDWDVVNERPFQAGAWHESQGQSCGQPCEFGDHGVERSG